MFVDKGQHARKSELCWSMLSTLLVLLWLSAPCRCAAPKKISLVNEVLVGLEWRGLIGQQNQTHRHNQRQLQDCQVDVLVGSRKQMML